MAAAGFVAVRAANPNLEDIEEDIVRPGEARFGTFGEMETRRTGNDADHFHACSP